jgi:hypothetical protein
VGRFLIACPYLIDKQYYMNVSLTAIRRCPMLLIKGFNFVEIASLSSALKQVIVFSIKEFPQRVIPRGKRLIKISGICIKNSALP